jgi:L-malate glycosyltransferase
LNQTGLQKNVEFHGHLSPSELSSLYQKCDFYVCSSEWESFGLSALEALFTGLPVLSTNCGGVSDFISPGNGILIENDQQPETLRNGLFQMVKLLPDFKRKTIAAEIRSRFSNQHIKEEYNKIYKSISHTIASSVTN